MSFLSPAKILVVVIVAIIVLGPDKLPTVARQVGRLWSDFRRLRERLETDVRGSFPDLPSTDKITQAVRSPISFLDSLADTHDPENQAVPPEDGGPGGGPAPPTGDGVRPSGAANRPNGSVRAEEETSLPGVSISDPQGAVHRVRANGRAVPDDPSLN